MQKLSWFSLVENCGIQSLQVLKGKMPHQAKFVTASKSTDVPCNMQFGFVNTARPSFAQEMTRPKTLHYKQVQMLSDRKTSFNRSKTFTRSLHLWRTPTARTLKMNLKHHRNGFPKQTDFKPNADLALLSKKTILPILSCPLWLHSMIEHQTMSSVWTTIVSQKWALWKNRHRMENSLEDATKK